MTDQTTPKEGAILPYIAVIVVIAVLVVALTPRPSVSSRVALAPTEAPAVAVAPTEAPTQELPQDHLTLMMLGLEEVNLSDVQKGQRVYSTACTACHGLDAKGVKGLGKTLINSGFVNQLNDDELIHFIIVGRTTTDPANTTGQVMPAKGGNLSLKDEDISAVVAYIRSLNGAKIVNDLTGVPTSTPPPVREFAPINVSGLPSSSNVAATLVPTATPQPTATPAPADASTGTTADALAGKADYERACASCHASDGTGTAMNFNSDLTDSMLDDSALFALLTVPQPIGSPNYPHPIRGGYPELNDEQVRAVIAYMKTLMGR